MYKEMVVGMDNLKSSRCLLMFTDKETYLFFCIKYMKNPLTLTPSLM